MGCNRTYFGKYRGKVESNSDLSGLGRVQVSCPAVLGDGSASWAMPSSPYAGPGVGFFALPPEGANIWVEFEGGDPDYPIWSGCFWGKDEMLEEVQAKTENAKDYKAFKTDAFTLVIHDDDSKAGGVTIEIKDSAVENTIKLVCDKDGVKLTVGDKVSATLTKEDIKFAVGENVSELMTENDITLAIGEDSKVVMSADGVEITGAKESTLKMTSSEIEAANGQSKAKLESSGIELSNGSGKVKIESSGVKINDGAVEVQ